MTHNSAQPMHYRAAWHAMWRSLGLPATDTGLLEALLGRYSEPHRHYHTLQHLDACLAHFAELRNQATHPAEVELALWFHDAVYEIHVPDNELRSAEWARSVLMGAGAERAAADRVFALVLATCHDREPQTGDEAILLDVDLAILGSAPARFDAYEARIRAEYAMVPIDRFRGNRRRILREFLDRERIFHTPHFYIQREQQARDNLRRSLDQSAD